MDMYVLMLTLVLMLMEETELAAELRQTCLFGPRTLSEHLGTDSSYNTSHLTMPYYIFLGG